jgi:hypothetical protein
MKYLKIQKENYNYKENLIEKQKFIKYIKNIRKGIIMLISTIGIVYGGINTYKNYSKVNDNNINQEIEVNKKEYKLLDLITNNDISITLETKHDAVNKILKLNNKKFNNKLIDFIINTVKEDIQKGVDIQDPEKISIPPIIIFDILINIQDIKSREKLINFLIINFDKPLLFIPEQYYMYF